METQAPPKIVTADKSDDSVIVTFSDGTCAVYSSEVLQATISQAKIFQEPDLEDDEVSDVNPTG